MDNAPTSRTCSSPRKRHIHVDIETRLIWPRPHWTAVAEGLASDDMRLLGMEPSRGDYTDSGSPETHCFACSPQPALASSAGSFFSW